MGLFGGSVKKLEQSGDVYGLVKRLLDSDGHLGEVRSIGIVAALGRLGSSAVPPLFLLPTAVAAPHISPQEASS